MMEIQVNGGQIADKVDFAYKYFEKAIPVDAVFTKAGPARCFLPRHPTRPPRAADVAFHVSETKCDLSRVVDLLASYRSNICQTLQQGRDD